MKEESREQIIRRIITGAVGRDMSIQLVDVNDSETGEVIESEIPVNRDRIREIDMKGNCVEPYRRKTINKQVKERFLNPLGNADFRRVDNMMDSIDAFGRIKYGEHLNQYCRTYDDLSLVVDLGGKQLSRFLKTIKELDIIRIVTVKKSFEEVQYITCNPALTINGNFFDRFTVIAWEDVIREYGLITDKQIAYVLKGVRSKEIERLIDEELEKRGKKVISDEII